MDVEKEVDERVKFKLNDILSNIEQSIHRNKALSFNFAFGNELRKSDKCLHYSEAFEKLREVFLKEISLPVPYDNMHIQKQKEKRNKAVDDIMKIMPLSERRRVNAVVKIVEECMGL